MSGINDFVVKFATVNGSGSASANTIFAKTLFRMGLAVSPKNIFPSNIQGLPTWYEVRVSDAGYIARREGIDLMVAMNPQTFKEDLAEVVSGGWLLYNSTLPRVWPRDDISVVGIPIAQLCAQKWSDPRQRQLFKNMVYVGALTALLDIDVVVLKSAIVDQLKGKEKLVAANMEAVNLGRDFAGQNFHCPLPVRVRAAQCAKGKIMVSGNDAAGLGAIYGGATVCAWYPITPSTSLAEAYEKYARRLRVTKDGKRLYGIVQAEDELAAVGIAIGGGWNGARAFTATSGPGISLMSEFWALPILPKCRWYCSISSVGVRPPACPRARSSPTSFPVLMPRTGTQNRYCCSPPIPANASRWGRRPSTLPSACRPRSSSCRISISA